MFIEGATLGHYTGDREAKAAEVADTLGGVRREFLTPSLAPAGGAARGRRGPAARRAVDPAANEDSLHLPHDVVVREVAFYLLAGAHTSATAFTRVLHNVFTWLGEHPEDADRVRTDRVFVQRCTHETIRLQPSSPAGMRWALADVELESGRAIPEGDKVVIDLMQVNRDTSAFGADADGSTRTACSPIACRRTDCRSAWACTPASARASPLGMIYDGTDEPVEEHLFGLVPMAVQSDVRSRRATGSRRSAGDGHDDRSPVLRSLPGAARSLIVPAAGSAAARTDRAASWSSRTRSPTATAAMSSSLCTSTLTTCSSADRPAFGPKAASRSASGSDPWPGSRRWWRASETNSPSARRRSHRVAELQPAEAPRCQDHLELSSAGPHTHVVQHVDHDDAARPRGDRHGFGRRRRIGPRHVLEPDEEAEGLGDRHDVGDAVDRRAPVACVGHHQHRRRASSSRLLEQRRRIDARSDADDLGVVQGEPEAAAYRRKSAGSDRWW